MGLYAKARKLISAQEKERKIVVPIIDFSSSSEQENEPVHESAHIDLLVKQIGKDIDQDSRFIIISVSLDEVIDGIRQSTPESKKNDIPSDVMSFIMNSASNVAHAYKVSENRMILVVQSADSIDLELLVHQIYSSLRNFFVGCPGDDCTIFKSKARIFPQDGNDIRKLIQDVIS